MDSMTSKLSLELALIINHEAIGPSFCAATLAELKEVDQQQMFASRVILTAGIGDQLLTSKRLHGPIEVIEVKEQKFNMVFFPFHHMIPGVEEKGYGEIRRVSILTIFYEEKVNQEILPLIPFMEKQVREIVHETQLEKFLQKLDNVDQNKCEGIRNVLMKVKEELEYRISLRYEGIRRGTSLFDLGVVSKLPSPYKQVGLVMIQDPDGWDIEDLKAKLPEENELEKLVKDLMYMGFVMKKQGKFIPL